MAAAVSTRCTGHWQHVLLGLLLSTSAWLVLGSSTGQTANISSLDLEQQASLLSESSLKWLQRPNLYFGMRARTEGDSPLFGLLWFGVHDYTGYQKIRHSCEQADNLAGYHWQEHDGRSTGKQIINDVENNLRLTVNILRGSSGASPTGGSWAARISGEPLDPSKLSRVSLVSYYALEGLGSLDMTSHEKDDTEGVDGDISLTGSVPSLGEFTFRQVEVSNPGPPSRGRHADDFGSLIDRIAYSGVPVPAGQSWRAKDIILNDIVPGAKALIDQYGQDNLPDPALLFALSRERRSGSNFWTFQRTYEGSFSFDVFYDPIERSDEQSVGGRLDSLSLSAGIQASSSLFVDRFEQSFELSSKGFNASQIQFAQSLTSSMLGGIGYFYGTSVVDRNFRHEYDMEDEDDDDENDFDKRQPKPEIVPERGLFTATPSRSFFPRGFYWDEGFHLLLIGAWDNDLSLDILRSWVELIDEDGWVGREQILGEEARSKVPQEFQTQYPAYANPPTLAMAVTQYIKRLQAQPASQQSPEDPFAGSGESLGSPAELLASLSSSASHKSLADLHVFSPQLAQSFLSAIYPKLRLHYNWFRATQRGQIKEWGRQVTGARTEAYRWRGRSQDHVLTSGLDDYPRPTPPHVGELHVDLMSWMAFFSRTMKQIADYIGESEDVKEYARNEKAILINLDELHWSDEQQMYCDASVDDFTDESIHVCHQGYISIFPFLLGLLEPDSPHLGAILKALRDPEQLWSNFGIRSLSQADPFFGQGENYWRGPIWVQMNYLALQSLYNIYAKQAGPYQTQAAEIYDELRTNVITNVYKEYERTGYAWEQYNPHTGHGQRTHPFTGWTSLVALIMAEQY